MSTTVFLRLLEAEDKAAALASALHLPPSPGQSTVRFDLDSSSFASVPRSPFAYWISPELRKVFRSFPRFETEQRIARVGLQTSDDFRFLRDWTEISPAQIDGDWLPYARGGASVKLYSDLGSVVRWSKKGREIAVFGPSKFQNTQHFGKPGITWPLRASAFSPQARAAGSGFSVRAYSVLVDNPRTLLAVLAVLASTPFDAIFKFCLGRTGFPEFIVGILQDLPMVEPNASSREVLAGSAKRGWSVKRDLDTCNEESHAFSVPALVRLDAPDLATRAQLHANAADQSTAELDSIQCTIDEACFLLYGISDEDRLSIEQGFAGATAEPDDADKDDCPEGETLTLDTTVLATQLASWAFGVALGRFDLRLATRERPLPPKPDPFDALPACSPGMLTGADGLPLDAPPANYPIAFPTDGILVDDLGHDRDVLARIREVFTVVFGDNADDRLQEAVSILDPGQNDLRSWLRRTFFEEHIQRYSKSRRKAPIYWRLGTPSGSYSVWIYLHRFNKDTLHRVLNDHIAPKLRYETNKLDTLRSEAGPSPTPSQRRALADQETLVDELRTLHDQVERVAPLWDPDLDDGVVINASFLHRLFAHTRSWQKECESHWLKLQAAEYDWAHLAMRLWPERVVPKCADDRSLAIAHGLEEVLWLEGTDGKWRPLP